MLKWSGTNQGATAQSFPVPEYCQWVQALLPSPGAMGLLTPQRQDGWMQHWHLGDGKAPKPCSPKPQSPISHTNQPLQPVHLQRRGAFISSVVTDTLSQCSRCLQPLGDRTRQKATRTESSTRDASFARFARSRYTTHPKQPSAPSLRLLSP